MDRLAVTWSPDSSFVHRILLFGLAFSILYHLSFLVFQTIFPYSLFLSALFGFLPFSLALFFCRRFLIRSPRHLVFFSPLKFILGLLFSLLFYSSLLTYIVEVLHFPLFFSSLILAFVLMSFMFLLFSSFIASPTHIGALYTSPVFLSVLGLKVLFSFFFGSASLTTEVLPFVDYFVTSGFHNPYQYFFDLGQPSVFPYPSFMLYLLSLPRVLLYVLHPLVQSSFFDLFLLRLPLLFADILLYTLLSKILLDKSRSVLWYYWCSPVVFYLTYFAGYLAAIPIALLFLSLTFLLARRFMLSLFFFGLSMATKNGILVVAPLFLIYLWRRRLSFFPIFRSFFVAGFAYLILVFPHLFSRGFWSLNFLANPQLQTYSFSLSPSYQIFLLPAVYAVMVLYFFTFKKINKDMLIMMIALVMMAFVLFTPPRPDWYYWGLPFLAYFFIKEKTTYSVNYWAFTAFFVLHSLFWIDSDFFSSLFPLLSRLSFPSSFYVLFQQLGLPASLISDVSYTLLTASLALSGYWIYQYGIRSTLLYKQRDTPVLIGIAGDSASGKTTTARLLTDLLGKDSVTVLRGDDLHRWERGDTHWSTVTHLNPHGNRLQLGLTHLADLKAGKQIQRSQYDHDTGRFTLPIDVKPNSFVLFEGLHSFYIRGIRDLCDIKIFLDPDDSLRKNWKVLRDMKERGYKKEAVLKQLEKREKDSFQYISPQRKFADLIISFKTSAPLKAVGTSLSEQNTYLDVTVDNSIDADPLIDAFSRVRGLTFDHIMAEDLSTQSLRFKGFISREEVSRLAHRLVPHFDDLILNDHIVWNDGYNGLIQLLFLYHLSERSKQRL